MKQLILSLILLFNILEANRLSFTKKDVETIKHLPQKKAALKRILMYNELKEKIKDYSTIRKLSHINAFYNKIMPVLDQTQYKIGDHWATRKEFLIQGKGDCEDYVIAKYFTLIELGFETKDFSLLQVEYKKQLHLVLTYKNNKEKMVLDNINKKILNINERKDLKALYEIQSLDLKAYKNKKITHLLAFKWNELLQRLEN